MMGADIGAPRGRPEFWNRPATTGRSERERVMICLLIDVDGSSREVVLPFHPAERAALVDGLIGAAWTVRVAIARGLDLWAGAELSGSPARPVNGPASALAADLSGDPWRDYHGPVLICGLELGEAGEEHDVDLTADQIAALRRRLGRQSAG